MNERNKEAHLDRIGVALASGEVVTKIVRDNGWSFRDILVVEPTNVPGAYFVKYDYRGEVIKAVVFGSEVVEVITRASRP